MECSAWTAMRKSTFATGGKSLMVGASQRLACRPGRDRNKSLETEKL